MAREPRDKRRPRRLPMNHFAYAIDINIKRFQDLLETAVDETERQTIQKLLVEEKERKTALQAAEAEKT
jgi:hypothetical protein